MVILDALSPERHISQLFGSTYKILTKVREAFHYMNKDMVRKVLTNMIHVRLKYAAMVWSPYMKRDVRKLMKYSGTS